MLRSSFNKAAAAAKRFLAEDNGPVAVEYAVLLALVIVVAISSISQLGLAVSDIFETASGVLRTL